MEKCKFCQAELAENGKFCPVCGKNNAEEEPVAEEVTAAVETAAEETVPAEETAAEETAEAAAEEKTEEASEEKSEEAAAPEIKEGAKATPGKIALAVAAVVVLLAVLIALVVGGQNKAEGDTIATEPAATTETTEATVPATHPADGNPDDVTCKGTYTVTDEEAAANKDVIVATMGDKQLTNGQLQVYYWTMVNSYLSSEYGYYMMYYGMLDYTKPLDTQLSVEDNTITWQQYFVDEALNYWQLNQALSIEAEAAGLEMSEENREYLDTLETSLGETAAYYGMESVDELLLHNIGPGAGLEEFHFFQQLYYQGKPYYDAEIEKLVPTAEELEAYFAEHEEDYAAAGVTKDGKYVDVRHILITPEGGTTDESGNTTYTDEEWAACEAKAQEILDAWLAGEATEDSFAALANEHSTDPGSNTNGGLYEDVYVGQMVEPFETWCFDEARVVGDTGLVKTTYGYHVMYFVGSSPIWESYAKSDWVGEQTNAMIDALGEKYPLEVDYSAITLGYVNLGS